VSERTVTKEYCEDLPDDPSRKESGPTATGSYLFDFGNARYRARVYVDEPEVAYVLDVGGDRADPPRDAVLRVVASELAPDGVRKLQMLGASGAFEPVFP
jgi:hypothetical protein